MEASTEFERGRWGLPHAVADRGDRSVDDTDAMLAGPMGTATYPTGTVAYIVVECSDITGDAIEAGEWMERRGTGGEGVPAADAISSGGETSGVLGAVCMH